MAYNALLNSYSILFFSRQKVFGVLLLLASFAEPSVGFCGLLSLVICLSSAKLFSLSDEQITNGTLGFNSLLMGLALGDVFELNLTLCLTLIPASFLCLMLTVGLSGWLSKYSLPFLSIPFVVACWIVFLATRKMSGMVLSDHNIFYQAPYGLDWLAADSPLEIHHDWTWYEVYFKSLSAIFFQKNMLTGILMSIGLLIFSRIAFTLSILGLLSALVFYKLTGFNSDELVYHYSGFNFILTSVALGGYFLLPSFWSYCLAVFLVPIVVLLNIALIGFMEPYQLPVYSLAFSLVTSGILYLLYNRLKIGRLQLVPYQYEVPEINLYRSRNHSQRFRKLFPFRFSLPVLGKWLVSQGYEGEITHKGQFKYALDFILLDDELRSYTNYGAQLEDFYCYGKPVLAPADGWIEQVVNIVDENPVGKVNIEENWGNTLIIRHAEGLYSKLSHLKKDSIRVYVGQYVHKGELLASVGNSGRSPEPHLHFQIQATPWIGAYTLPYPMSMFLETDHGKTQLREFEVPNAGSFVENIDPNTLISNAFDFSPGKKIKVTRKGKDQWLENHWEVFTSSLNQTYVYCHTTNSTLWFVNNGQQFYCTHFDGDQNSVLFAFYRAAYKVVLGNTQDIPFVDDFPMDRFFTGIIRWSQDFISPFYQFITVKFLARLESANNVLESRELKFFSTTQLNIGGRNFKEFNHQIQINNQGIELLKVSSKQSEWVAYFSY